MWATWLARLLAAALLAAALVLTPSVWLDARGVVATARVVGKKEDLLLERGADGEWKRRWWLRARFTSADQREREVNVKFDRETYDRTPVGARIQVRYLPCCPIVARSVDRSTSTMLADWRHGLRLPLFAHDAVAPGLTSARVTSARVHRVERVLESRGTDDSRSLPMPYELVEFAFVPLGRGDSIRSADAVDSGSVRGLFPRAILTVRYDAANPRRAQLVAGTRTFPAKNRALFWQDLLLLGLLPALVLVGWTLSLIRKSVTRGRTALDDFRAASGSGSFDPSGAERAAACPGCACGEGGHASAKIGRRRRSVPLLSCRGPRDESRPAAGRADRR